MLQKVIVSLLLALLLALPAQTFAQEEVEREEATAAREGQAWIGVILGDALDGGAEIVALLPGAPAAAADLRTGDIIVEANQAPIASRRALGRVMQGLRPGDRLDVAVVRGGEVVDASVQLGRKREHWTVIPRRAETPRRPERSRTAATARWNYRYVLNNYGIEVTPLTSALRRHYGAPEDAGLLVTRCDPEAAAGQAGIQVGDVLVQVGELKMQNVDQLERQLLHVTPQGSLDTLLVRGREPRELTVSLSPATLDMSNVARSAAEYDRQALERRLRLELERLERRAEELRRALKELEDKR
jgi:C-terminal processing protease CtpA/Prc